MNWKDIYINKIGSANLNELRIEEAQSLKIAYLPAYLYKYRQANEFAIDNLENDTVWLNTPQEYNDPFEFVEYLDHDRINKFISKQMQEGIISEMTKHNPVSDEIIQRAKDSDDPLKEIAKYQLKTVEGIEELEIQKIFKILDDFSKTNVNNRHIEKIKNLQSKMKVCSFCESPKQLLMWSHYADYHKGFCIEYNIARWHPNDGRKRILYPVIYQADFYDVSEHIISQLKNQSFNNVYPIISGATKSKDWEYEQEWRFIFNIGDSFPKQNYSMDCQSKIFLGSRMTKDNRNKIIEICKRKGIEIFEAIPSIEKYHLEFISI